MRMMRLLGLLSILLPSLALAQLSRPLQIQNAGTTSTPVRYNLNFVNSGCVDNSLTLAKDCTIGASLAGFVDAPLSGEGTSASHLSCPTCATTTGFTATGAILLPAGTAAAPSLAFSGGTATGIRRSGANELWMQSSNNSTNSVLALRDTGTVLTGDGVGSGAYSTLNISGDSFTFTPQGATAAMDVQGTRVVHRKGLQNLRTAFSDAAYAVAVGEGYIVQTGTLTAARTVTLPVASTVSNRAYMIEVVDESGSATGTNKITVIRSSTDTVNGVTTAVDCVAAAYGRCSCTSDGTSKWICTRAVP